MFSDRHTSHVFHNVDVKYFLFDFRGYKRSVNIPADSFTNKKVKHFAPAPVPIVAGQQSGVLNFRIEINI